ncbi:hypothetical protein L249_5964 [Ophiocordyceps polyrhachis-furcata BCC 54312]|uniref:Uncharacterized protein n=1 Tax=Ophiocordyceps polyrhachis-furcata BCC 54312 TaxID=1330021 RepID=A0A367LIB6_9HYPO|nr:hypothetical protein L249_5964 [Ophiocordyceps polyrhachis-furcata BCC 54312]
MAPSAAPLDRAPGNTVGRSISRHSGHYSDRHSDRRAVLIAVIAPDLDGRTKVRSGLEQT